MLFVRRYVKSNPRDLLLILQATIPYAYLAELFAELPCVSGADQILERDLFLDLEGINRHFW